MKTPIVAAGIVALVAGFLLGSPLPAEGRDRPAIMVGDPGNHPRNAGPCRECVCCDERGFANWRPRYLSKQVPDFGDPFDRAVQLLPGWAAIAIRLSKWSPVALR